MDPIEAGSLPMTSENPFSYRLLTPRGRGAVAVISIGGDLSAIDALLQAANGKPISDQELERIHFGHWSDEDIVFVKQAVDQMELHCHGGQAAVERIRADLERFGGVPALTREWDAPIEHLSDLKHHLEIAITKTTTQKTAHAALRQSQLWPEFIDWLGSASRDEALEQIDRALAWANFGRHLIIPWSVVLCGRPNVGKSSLINALVGFERSVVFDQPGTTRDIVSAETAVDGWPIELSDTAGLRGSAAGLEAAGIERARQRIAEADLLILVLDQSQELSHDDYDLLQEFPDAVVVINKADLPVILTQDEWNRPVWKVSAKTGVGVPELIDAISQRLVSEEPQVAQVFPLSDEVVSLLNRMRQLMETEPVDERARWVSVFCHFAVPPQR
ncbi:MAG: 50S ribosome-binding GTPase [Planctomycetaceae bacterium]|nr:50S ribosome-binding GTPase [Planctomycetaceae bacterium]